jgi:hypothetical protein
MSWCTAAAAGPGRRTPTPFSPISTAPGRMSPLTNCPGVTPMTGHPGHGYVTRSTTEPQRTAAAHSGEARPADAVAGGGQSSEFFAALGDACRRTDTQRARLAPAVEAALDTGWTPRALASATGANTAGVRNPYAVLATRLSPAELRAPPTRSTRPPWCGECDPVTRMLNYHGDAPRPCPRCKAPRAGAPAWKSATTHAFESCAPPAVAWRAAGRCGFCCGMRTLTGCSATAPWGQRIASRWMARTWAGLYA